MGLIEPLNYLCKSRFVYTTKVGELLKSIKKIIWLIDQWYMNFNWSSLFWFPFHKFLFLCEANKLPLNDEYMLICEYYHVLTLYTFLFCVCSIGFAIVEAVVTNTCEQFKTNNYLIAIITTIFHLLTKESLRTHLLKK